jgi:cell wall-associated NlpC family hydrolase
VSAKGTRTRSWIRAAVLSVIGGIALPLAPSVAWADPGDGTPGTVAEASALVERTAQQLTTIDEQVQQADLTVATEQKTATDATAQYAAAKTAVDAYGPQLRAIAQSGVTAGTSSRVAAFLTSSSADDLVQRMATLDLIAQHTETVIGQVAAAADAARQAKATADAATARAQASLATLQQQKKQLQDRVTAYRADYQQLSAADQAKVTRALAGPSVAAPATSQVVAGAPSAVIATVLRTALAQLGKPYAYGATGAGSFDCSGLTAYAYAAAGITLPHSSGAQSKLGRAVSRADLQPGDIVYFYTPVSHVGIYLGDGKMVEARTFGQPVSVTSVDRSGFRGAVRLVG